MDMHLKGRRKLPSLKQILLQLMDLPFQIVNTITPTDNRYLQRIYPIYS